MGPDQPSTAGPLQAKWGSSLEQGFVVIPVLLLKRQRELGLDSTEVVILMNLLAAWWDPDRQPHPRSMTIAQRMGVSVRTVQRTLERLEVKGFLSRKRAASGHGAEHRELTSYDMRGTVEKLLQVAEVAQDRRQKIAGGSEVPVPTSTQEAPVA